MQSTRRFIRSVVALSPAVFSLSVMACQTEFKDAPVAGGDPAAPTAGVSPGTAGTPPAGGTGAGTMAQVGGMAAPAAGGVGGTGPEMAGTGAGAGGMPASGGSGGGGEPMGGTSGATDVDAGTHVEPEPPSCPATSMLQPGDSTEMIDAGGRSRRYLLHVPPSYDGVTPMPVLFDWHALLINATSERRITGNLALSDREGFIVVYPEGIDAAWNVGICCTSSRDVDDLAFARAMVERLGQQGCIDHKRIYATGYSMGGGMSFHLACNEADLFAAVAPAAFDLMIEEEWPCHPSRPIPVIQFRSTGDFVVRYGGGTHYPPNGLPVENNFLGAEGTFAKWAELDGCTGTPMRAANGCNTYTQCEGGVEVALCTTQGGSHDPPDAEKAWQFLSRFSLP